ncbi:PREDICTED: 5-azacytidine-induced protein 2 [Nanorana parkeri]|uniref:5-azacytidine-induced protein 2 n=1 Tax=Nanorana parkeri TaxID=125878 RepID=UPI000854068B|nr:PREDICTED: 5-azacytidine-induced protein 2 [Nanorana parkeri]
MDSLLDDDICILNHEKEDFTRRRDQDTPFSASSGEASVASHFALVTAYEDIKKRLKDTEKENSTLKKRLRQMDEKLCGSCEEHSRDESDKVNRAYSAFREISLERDNLKQQLTATEKEKNECTKHLNEQLQSKEVELLQVKSELETHQVMKSLSKTPTDWEIEKLNSELKIRSVEQELKLLQEECGRLRAELQRTKTMTADKSLFGNEFYQANDTESEFSARQVIWELKKEMSNLHLVTEVQAEVLRKLKGTVVATRKASRGPVQCEEDLEKNCGRLRISATSVTYEKAPHVSSTEYNLCDGASAPQPRVVINTLQDKNSRTQWTNERPSPVGGTDCEEADQKSSFEENSWVMPSPPKPSETLFWEAKNNSSPNNTGQYYSPKYSFKS